MANEPQTEVPSQWSVEATRSGSWWALSVPGLRGVYSQCRRLDQVEQHVREAIALLLDIDEAEVGMVDVAVVSPQAVTELVRSVRQADHTALDAVEAASRARKEAARTLVDQGYPLRDIGQLIGISHQRVSQILADA